MQLLALEQAIPRLEARRLRRALRLAPEVKLTADGVYDLVLAETESAEIAAEAMRQFAAAQLRAGDGE